MNFKQWLSEAIVDISNIGEAIKKTLQFKIEAEWIKLDLQHKGWSTDKGVKKSIDIDAAFYHEKIQKPAFFFLRVLSVIVDPSKKYDSISGDGDVKIIADIFLFNGKSGLSSSPMPKKRDSLNYILNVNGHVLLSKREDSISYPGALSEFDGPSLKTPLELANWVNKVISNIDLGSDDDDNHDSPEDPIEPISPQKLIKV
jgi:hypothetical protein